MLENNKMQTSNNQKLPLSLWLYITLWIFFVYLYIQILFFSAENSQNILLSGLYFIEFGVHEASHLVFFFLSSILTAAAGSIGEISFTLLIVFAALKARSYFAAIFGCIWVMLAMNSAGRYMADARTQQIPLIGPGETVNHDWYYVFSQLGWLDLDVLIGTTIRSIGDIIGALALVFGLYLIVSKIITDNKGFS